ncbi:MAG: hypothetical protein A2072_03215 [Nitrospirae bacterium GWC1_57_7]|nr:MAG: hypothetical protein A2072_03215 [Nitrospirae bacterium GWC1_57_7]
MFRTTVVAALIAVFALSGCTDRGDSSEKVLSTNFALQDLNGKTVNLTDFRGRVVLLDFWATWCPPCRSSIPAMEQLHKEYSAKGLVLLGISLDHGDWDYVKSFRQEDGITYPILKGNDDISEQYMVRTIPYLVLLDKEGVVRRRITGPGGEDTIKKDLQGLL